jgi:hypothetical protein
MLQHDSEPVSAFTQTAAKALAGEIALFSGLSHRQQKRATSYVFAVVSNLHPGVLALIHFTGDQVTASISFQEENAHLWDEFSAAPVWPDRSAMVMDFADTVNDCFQHPQKFPRHFAPLPVAETKKFLTAFLTEYQSPTYAN